MSDKPEPNPSPPPALELPQQQVLGEQRWAEVANHLFALLDDIDTLYDMCKGDEHAFYAQVARVHGKRFYVGQTDGYRVVFA